MDLGFRGVDADNPGVEIIHRGRYKSLTSQHKRWLKRRQAIEPMIGHTKSDHRMDRCWLQGALGDALHAISCAAGYDIRWLLRAITRLAAKRSLLVLLKLAMPGRISVNVSLVSMLWLDLSTTQQGDRTRRFWGELDDVEKVGLTGVVHDLAAFDRLRGAGEALALRSGGLHEGLELDDAGPPSMMVR